MQRRLPMALVILILISATAMAGNGSRKIEGFAPDGSAESPDVDGVGVITFSSGTGETSLHVVLTDLMGETEYVFFGLDETGGVIIGGSFTTNKPGNGNGKASLPSLIDESDSISDVVIYRVDSPNVLVARSTTISD